MWKRTHLHLGEPHGYVPSRGHLAGPHGQICLQAPRKAEVARRLLKNPGWKPALRRRDIIRLTSNALRELEDTRFREKVMCEFVRLGLDLDLHEKQDDQVCAAVAKVLRSPTVCSWYGEPLTFLQRRDAFASG